MSRFHVSLLHLRESSGYSLLELMLALATLSAICGLSVPVVSSTIEEIRAAASARYVATRIANIRLDAVRRSSTVGLRFEQQGDDHLFTPFLDGNGNGLRTADITSGLDRPLGRTERLAEHFAGTSFGLLAGVPDLDGVSGNPDGVRIGASSFLSMSPDGSCTGGTLYIHGRRSQYAVRILGATGRVRFYRYDTGGRRWITR